LTPKDHSTAGKQRLGVITRAGDEALRRTLGQMSGKESLSISAPELGSKTLYANLGRAAGETNPNVYALIWNPRV
jgi:transposase